MGLVLSMEGILQHLQIDGWWVVEGVIPADDVSAVRDEVELATTAQGASRTHSATGILHHVPSFLPCLSDERVLSVATSWFGPHVRISHTSTLITDPGNERGGWHADWPYNQEKAGHIQAPYPDFPFQLSTLWMLSDFTRENGGTLIVPGSHRASDNPTGTLDVDRFEPYPTEMQVTGAAGSVLVFDSRLWHSTAANTSAGRRVAMVVRYVPWWFNLELLMPGSEERKRIVEEGGRTENEMPPVPADVYERLPEKVKPLYRHWVR